MPVEGKVFFNVKHFGAGGAAVVEVCREISIKDICEDCERTTLYPEVNCGQPTSFTFCEEVPLGFWRAGF